MSRPIGANFHVPHGMSNAMLVPAVTSFSLAHATKRYATVRKRSALLLLTGGSEHLEYHAVPTVRRMLSVLTQGTRSRRPDCTGSCARQSFLHHGSRLADPAPA
jgi:alcohol dehydrogenase class IV